MQTTTVNIFGEAVKMNSYEDNNDFGSINVT
jgi:hypothetical protein